jgi:hypothetical protein
VKISPQKSGGWMKMFHKVLADERKKHITLLLHGRKSITIFCPDDVCKKIRKKREKEREVMHGER